jgi:nucleoside-diphosphate-sugar epimerase
MSLKSAAPYASLIGPIVISDIAASGAYDEAVRDVKYVVHVASPFASQDLWTSDFEHCYVKPAVNSTVGILKAASKCGSVKRVVLTSSILAILSLDNCGGDLVVDGGSM